LGKGGFWTVSQKLSPGHFQRKVLKAVRRKKRDTFLSKHSKSISKSTSWFFFKFSFFWIHGNFHFLVNPIYDHSTMKNFISKTRGIWTSRGTWLSLQHEIITHFIHTWILHYPLALQWNDQLSLKFIKFLNKLNG
jgi:hypothetical protein